MLDYRYPYLIDHPDEIAEMTHTFIVRDPRQAISSHYAMKPTVTCPEIGYQRLHELFELTWSVTGRKPLVIRAEALIGEPAAVVRRYCEAVGLPYLPEALRWQPSDRPEWQRHRAWHLDAIASAGFEDRQHRYPVNVDNNNTLKAFYRYHYPFYRSIVQHAIGTGASMTADTFSPPAATGSTAQAAAPADSGVTPSPGTVFARAFAADGERTEVSFDYTITDAHKPAREKARLTVRSLLKKRLVDADEITFWRESRPSEEDAAAVPARDYYRLLVGHGSLLADLAANGILISRIRWVRPGQALAGDFAEAVRLLDAHRSAIRVAEPPPGTFAHPGLAVCAEINEGLAVHLPTHFFLAVPAGETEANG